MAILGALIILSVIGIGAVFWLLKNDPEKDQNDNIPASKPETAQAPTEPPPKSGLKSKFTLLRKKRIESTGSESESKLSLGSLKKTLTKINLGKKKSDETVSETTPMPNLKEYLASEKKDTGEAIQDENIASDQQTPLGTAGIKTIPVESPSEEKTISKEEKGNIEKEIELSNELSELKIKYDKLDALFSEKSTEYEKTKESLDHELANRKEFNKVKDLLEKELKESKDKTRDAQGELNNAQTENENQKKRTAQLEEKSNKLEKDLLQKEDKIDDLVKRMQAFASPSTAATPPEMEEKGEGGATEEAPQADQTPGDQPQVEQPPENQPQDIPPTEDSPTEAVLPSEEAPQSEDTTGESVPPQSMAVGGEETPSQPEDSQKETASPPEESTQKEETSDGDTPSQDATTAQKEDPSQSSEKPPEPEKTEQEGEEKDEKGEAPEQQSTEESPTQMGGFKLNLTIDQDEPSEEPEPEKKDFLKLQPDVLSGESQENDSTETSGDPPRSPPENTSDDRKTNP